MELDSSVIDKSVIDKSKFHSSIFFGPHCAEKRVQLHASDNRVREGESVVSDLTVAG